MRHRRLRIPSRLQEVRNHLNDREKGGSSGVSSFLASKINPAQPSAGQGPRGMYPKELFRTFSADRLDVPRLFTQRETLSRMVDNPPGPDHVYSRLSPLPALFYSPSTWRARCTGIVLRIVLTDGAKRAFIPGASNTSIAALASSYLTPRHRSSACNSFVILGTGPLSRPSNPSRKREAGSSGDRSRRRTAASRRQAPNRRRRDRLQLERRLGAGSGG